mmetsp:Transcript_73816/g.123320  ORF Transcript_73816/g.123320 Transcript_73816/m.123320 type:complete len:116 (-) Transcript_73816:364-711(-)
MDYTTHNHTCLQSRGNPRRPDRIRPPTRPPVAEDDKPLEFFAIGSMLCGFAAMFLRYKWTAWLSLLCCLGHLANLRADESTNLRQLMGSCMFSVSSLITSYARDRHTNSSAMAAT